MIDDMLVGIFGELVAARLDGPKRTKLLLRLFFGLLGAALGMAGAMHFTRRLELGAPMRLSIVAVFVFLACFSLFNIALARKWLWPGMLFVVSFVAVFVVRIVFGP